VSTVGGQRWVDLDPAQAALDCFAWTACFRGKQIRKTALHDIGAAELAIRMEASHNAFVHERQTRAGRFLQWDYHPLQIRHG
jgi:hypothetical protein